MTKTVTARTDSHTGKYSGNDNGRAESAPTAVNRPSAGQVWGGGGTAKKGIVGKRKQSRTKSSTVYSVFN